MQTPRKLHQGCHLVLNNLLRISGRIGQKKKKIMKTKVNAESFKMQMTLHADKPIFRKL